MSRIDSYLSIHDVKGITVRKRNALSSCWALTIEVDQEKEGNKGGVEIILFAEKESALKIKREK